MPRGIKKAKTYEKDIPLIKEEKLTTAELIYIGQFTTRVATTISALEQEIVIERKKLEVATEVFTQKNQVLNDKIDLITSDPVKYFKIVDAQTIFSTAASPTNTDNSNLTVDILRKMESRLGDIYSNSKGIGNMLYDEIGVRRRDRPFGR